MFHHLKFSSEISATQSESELEQIIPPPPKRIKRKTMQNLHLLQNSQTSQHTIFSASTSNLHQHDNIQQQTSGNNHLPPSAVYIVQPPAYQHTEIDTPERNNHAEANNIQTVTNDKEVPENVFTIDLDIDNSHPEYSANENKIQIVTYRYFYKHIIKIFPMEKLRIQIPLLVHVLVPINLSTYIHHKTFLHNIPTLYKTMYHLTYENDN